MSFSWFNNIIAMTIRGLTLVAKFLLILCLVKYFQPYELGLYGIISAVVAYALFFLGLEYFNYISRALVGASHSEQVLIIRDQFILYFISLIIFTPIFYGFFYFDFFPKGLWYWFLLITVVEHISNELMRIFIALAKPNLANVLFFIRQGLWVFILLAVYYFVPASRDFNLIFIAWAIGAGLSTVIGFFYLYYLPWKDIWKYPVRWQLMWKGLKVSHPFIISAFCALSLIYIERFFVNYYCGLEAVGIYTFFAGLSITIHTLVHTGVAKMRLAQLLSTWKSNDHGQFYFEAMNMLKQTIIFVLIFSALSLALIHPFITLINKEIYIQNIHIFYFLLVGAIFRSIADVPLYTLYAQHHDKLILSINLVSFFIIIMGNILLVPQFGLIGAAISSTAAGFVLVCIALFNMSQRTVRPFIPIEG